MNKTWWSKEPWTRVDSCMQHLPIKMLPEKCLVVGVEPKGTTRPKSRRRKDLALGASKENTRDLSQSNILWRSLDCWQSPSFSWLKWWASEKSNISSLQFSCSVVADSFRPHGLQHTRPPCPSPAPGRAQTHVHQVGDAIQPSYPLLSPSPPAFSLSQHQGHFQWVSSLHQVAKVLEFQLQHQSFQWIFRTDLL